MDLRESRMTELIQNDDRPKWISYNNHNIKCFTEAEIARITSNYGTMLGKGGFGEVYKGVLEDGSTVAVKRFVHNVEEDFAKELKVHSEINHKNVVRLIGYCADKNALMIVTEYIAKGNLSHVLHHDCIPIPLDTRLRIAVECSEALCYMHSQMYTHVIHGDIKPANILLDDNLNAKISDFGISRLVNTESTRFTDHVIGSIGYMDPLFARYGRLTSKSDVYSFGVVLLELITKKKATGRKGEINIVECFTQALERGIRRVRDLFDVEISSQNNMKVLEGVGKLAGECLRMEMDRRPEMTEVVERLRALRKTQAQGKQSLTIFPWRWRNKPAAQNGQSNLCRHFSLTEMKSVTKNFSESHLVGVGRSGTLSGRLYGYVPSLTWRQRLGICIGAARALQYLHERFIIHNDFTTTNILLDERLVAKVSVPRVVSPEEDTMSTGNTAPFIYLDPEFFMTMQLTEKSDVYSFGVMLFEVLCARAVLDPTLPSKQVDLVECVLNCKKKGILDLIVDPYLEGKIAPRCLDKFVETAEKCVADKSVDRPSMREVLQNLEMCLVEQSRGLGDEALSDDGNTCPSDNEGVDGDAQDAGSTESG